MPSLVTFRRFAAQGAPAFVRILIPTHQVGPGGIGTVVQGVRDWLPRVAGESHELVMVGTGPPYPSRVVVHATESGLRRGAPRVFHEQWRLARAARSVDVVHLCDHRPLVMSSTRCVITVHDVFFLDAPAWFSRGTGIYKRAMLASAMRQRPAAITCISNYTRDRLLSYYPEASRARLEVVYPGVEASEVSNDPDPGSVYFLTVSTIEPRKNYLRLLRAYEASGLRERGVRWKIIGAEGYRGSRIASLLRGARGVDVLGALTDGERDHLYAGALFVVTPSIAEGFGYPPLEAMARGVPTIAARGSALDETVDSASVRIDPYDETDIRGALRRVADDAMLRDDLRHRGYEQVSRFTWQAAAARYLELDEAANDG